MTKRKTAVVKKITTDNNYKFLLTILTWCLYIGWLVFLSSTKISGLNFIFHLLFLAVMIFIYRKELKQNWIDLKTSKKKVLKICLISLGCFILVPVSSILTSLLLQGLGYTNTVDASTNVIYTIFKVMPWGTLFASFLTIFFYPIVEELVFRKSLGNVIKNKVIFVVVSSLICWYFQVTLLSPTPLEFILAISTLLYGIYASIIYIKNDGNILYNIIPKMIYNLIICVIQIISLTM